MGNSCRLPPELCDLVIDHLHNDHATLKRCAVVCKDWTRASQYHLFGNLSFASKWTRTPYALADFLATRPDLAAYALSLGFRDGVPLSAVRVLLPVLPNLQSLAFLACIIADEEAGTLASAAPAPAKGIAELTMLDCVCSYDTFYAMLALFPSIGTFMLRDERFSARFRRPPPAGPLPPAVRQLAVDRLKTCCVASAWLATMFRGTRMAETVTAGQVSVGPRGNEMGTGDKTDSMEALGQVLRSMSKLRCLELRPAGTHVIDRDMRRGLWDRLGLAHFKSLQVLELPFRVSAHFHHNVCFGIKGWLDVVPHLPASVTELRFAMQDLPLQPVASITDSASTDALWDEVDRLLVDLPRNIHVRILLKKAFWGLRPPAEECRAVKGFIFKRLPRMARLGRLAVFEYVNAPRAQSDAVARPSHGCAGCRHA